MNFGCCTNLCSTDLWKQLHCCNTMDYRIFGVFSLVGRPVIRRSESVRHALFLKLTLLCSFHWEAGKCLRRRYCDPSALYWVWGKDYKAGHDIANRRAHFAFISVPPLPRPRNMRCICPCVLPTSIKTSEKALIIFS